MAKLEVIDKKLNFLISKVNIEHNKSVVEADFLKLPKLPLESIASILQFEDELKGCDVTSNQLVSIFNLNCVFVTAVYVVALSNPKLHTL